MKCVDKYCVDQLVKSEQDWEVRNGWHKQTREPLYIIVYALARLERNPVLSQKVFNDMHIVESLPSPAILKRLNYVKTANNMYQVYEHLPEGSLRDYLAKKIQLGEAEALEKLRQVVQCVHALHCNNTLHRNLRTSFFMVKDGELRLTGLLNAIQPDAMENDEIIDGREVFRAPETVLQPFDQKADMYSVGVIFHEMIFGNTPTRKTQVDPSREERTLAPQTVSLLKALLSSEPAMRPSCREVLQTIDPSPRPTRALQAFDPPSLQTLFFNFTQRMELLGSFGDKLSAQFQGVETAVYMLYTVLKKSSQTVTAFKSFLEGLEGSSGFEAERMGVCVRQLERECMAALVRIQNCLQKAAKNTLPPELARDLEELREPEWVVLKVLIVEPFFIHIQSMEGTEEVLEKTRGFILFCENSSSFDFNKSLSVS